MGQDATFEIVHEGGMSGSNITQGFATSLGRKGAPLPLMKGDPSENKKTEGSGTQPCREKSAGPSVSHCSEQIQENRNVTKLNQKEGSISDIDPLPRTIRVPKTNGQQHSKFEICTEC